MGYQFISGEASAADLLNKYDTFLFDCDGVLWSGSEQVTGAADALAKLRQAGKQIVFVTNNASVSRAKYIHKFEKMGIEAKVEEIVSSAYAAAVYVARVLKLGQTDRPKVYVLGMAGIEDELTIEKIPYCGGTDPKDKAFLPDGDSWAPLNAPDAIDPAVGAVVCGIDLNVNYIKLAKAYKHIMREGTHFILTNDDGTFPAPGGPWPGAGAISSPLRFATKKTPTIIGKPHQPILDSIQAVYVGLRLPYHLQRTSVLTSPASLRFISHSFDPKRTLFIGDRLDTDIAFGGQAGIDTLMVLTGISNKAEVDAPGAEIVPTFMADSLASALHVQ